MNYTDRVKEGERPRPKSKRPLPPPQTVISAFIAHQECVEIFKQFGVALSDAMQRLREANK